MSPTAWEAIFMLVILKIPIVYLCVVVVWAIRAEPRPLEGAFRPVAPQPQSRPWCGRRGPRPIGFRGGPHGSPVRRYPRGPAVVRAKAAR